MARKPIQAKLATDETYDPKRRHWRMVLFDGDGNPLPIQAILDRLVALEENAGLPPGPGGDSFVGDVGDSGDSGGGDPGDGEIDTTYTGAITYAYDATNGAALVIDDSDRTATELGFGTATTRQGWIDDLNSVGGVKYIASADGTTYALVRAETPTPTNWVSLSQGIFELNLPARGIDPSVLYSYPWPPVASDPSANAVGLVAENRAQAEAAVTYSTQHPSGSYNASKVFDGTDAFWASNGSALENWIVLDLGVGVAATPSSWSIRLRTDGNYNRPKDFKLQGSNDGAAWTDLDVHDDDIAPRDGVAGETLSWDFVGFYSYRYFRYLQTANWDGDNTANLTEFEVYGVRDSSISFGGVSGHPVVMLNNRNQQTITSYQGYEAVTMETWAATMASGDNSPVQFVDGVSGGEIWGVGNYPTLVGWDLRWEQRTWAEFEAWLASVGLPPWGDHLDKPSWIQ